MTLNLMSPQATITLLNTSAAPLKGWSVQNSLLSNPQGKSEEGQIEERDLEARSAWGKAGLAWNDGLKSYIHPLLKTGKVSWCYTWPAWPCCEGSGCPKSTPMLWGNKQISTWEKNVMPRKNYK